MNRITFYCLVYLMSFNVSVYADSINLEQNQISTLAEVNVGSYAPSFQIRQTQTQAQSSPVSSTVNEREDILTQLTIYGLVILAYSLYWLKLSH